MNVFNGETKQRTVIYRIKKNNNNKKQANKQKTFTIINKIKKQSTNMGQPFYGYSEKPPHFSRLFLVAWG